MNNMSTTDFTKSKGGPLQIDNTIFEPSKFHQLLKVSDEKQIKDFRLYQVHEVCKGKAFLNRQAMSAVIATINNTDSSFIYIVSGSRKGVSLHIGVATLSDKVDAHDLSKSLASTFSGMLLGSKSQRITNDNKTLEEELSTSRYLGVITGVPTVNEDETSADESSLQGIERLANSLIGEQWQLIITAKSISDDDLLSTINDINELTSNVYAQTTRSIQQSENIGGSATYTESDSASDNKSRATSSNKGKNTSGTEGSNKGTSSSDGTSNSGTNQSKTNGTSSGSSTSDTTSEGSSKSKSLAGTKSSGSSISQTREVINKNNEELHKYLNETLLQRFRLGRSKGMFDTGIYITAQKKATFDRLSSGVSSIFQGDKSTLTPLKVSPISINRPLSFKSLFTLPTTYCENVSTDELLIKSMRHTNNKEVQLATRLTAKEISLLASLPEKELPGIKIRKSVDFALNAGDSKHSDNLSLGKVVQQNSILPNQTVSIPRKAMSKHFFITGVTGSGKTTTCMKILLDSGLPFLVIEPAKTEYRALYNHIPDVEYYTLGREDLTHFRLNPFQLFSSKQNLSGHIKLLTATLAAVFPMEAAMPQIVEESIIRAYEAKYWDIHSNTNHVEDNPWETNATDVWPTFSDLITQLDQVIKSKGMGKEFEEKYQGSLVAKLSNLTIGTNGRMLNTRSSINFSKLLDKKVVIELEEIRDEQDKALYMGLIINQVAEAMKLRHSTDNNFAHITLIEEAHRLLAKPEPGQQTSQKQGVEMFANLLAEVRKYGESLIIADQIPSKLIPDVIKNTNTKIVHQLFSQDDRNIIGDSMSLTDEQKGFLPQLQPGEAIVYSGGWHAPVRTQIDEIIATNNKPLAEAIIQEYGNKQLWQQRHMMYPLLAQESDITNGQQLFEFVTSGRVLLEKFLLLRPKKYAHPMQIKLNDNIRTKIQGKFKQDITTLLVQLNKTTMPKETLANHVIESQVIEKLAHQLFYLFCDCKGISLIDETLQRCFTQALSLLIQSLAGYDEFILSKEDRTITQSFNLLKQYKSI
jgi:hypothetical protein